MAGSPLTLSLNEVEAMTLKAARGSGLAWGLAEDLARAARWLAERDLPWTGPLLTVLQPDVDDAPLREAFRAADQVRALTAGESWTTAPCPILWVVPLASAALRGGATALTLTVGECAIRLGSGGGASADGPWPDLAASPPCPILMRAEAPDPAFADASAPRTRRSLVDAEHWAALEALALRTTVPASAQSRAEGAGGGRVDDE